MKAIYFGILKEVSMGENLHLMSRIRMNLEPCEGFLYGSTLRELEFYIDELRDGHEYTPLIYKMETVKDDRHLLCTTEVGDELVVGDKVCIDGHEGEVLDIVHDITNNTRQYFTDIVADVVKDENFEENFNKRLSEVLCKCEEIYEKYAKFDNRKKMVIEKDSKKQSFWSWIFKI